MRRVRATAIAISAGVLILVSACGNGPPPGQGGNGGGATKIGVGGASLGAAMVKITATSADQFSPGSTHAKVGQIVQWTVASDSVPHNVTFDADSSVSSPQTVAPGQTWDVKFTAPGTYSYHCTIHPGMNGTITVGS